jgi:hypothetical protein
MKSGNGEEDVNTVKITAIAATATGIITVATMTLLPDDTVAHRTKISLLRRKTKARHDRTARRLFRTDRR